MRERRHDIRTSRKSVPGVPVSDNNSGYRLRSVNERIPESKAKQKLEKTVSYLKSAIRGRKKKLVAKLPEHNDSSLDLIADEQPMIPIPRTSRSGRRGSLDADSYIKKKFLYDVNEPPKRPRGRKNSEISRNVNSRGPGRRRRTTPSDNVSTTANEKSRSNRLHRILNNNHLDYELSNHSEMPRLSKTKSRRRTTSSFSSKMYDEVVNESSSETFPFSNIYSDKSNDLDPFKPQVLNQLFTDTNFEADHLQHSPVKDLDHESIDFSNLNTINEFKRFKHPESFGSVDDYSPAVRSDDALPVPVNHSLPEDTEDEDLLAPELSVLTGAAMVPNGNGTLVSTFSENNSVVTVSASGSRRKSPVRPMQVVRTKASHYPVVTTSPTTLISDASSVDHSLGLESNLTSQFNETTILCLPAMDSKSPAIVVPQANHHHRSMSQQSNLIASESNQTGLLPALLSQNNNQHHSALSRSFAATATGKSSTVSPSSSTAGQSPHSGTQTNVRKRPAILKRTLLCSVPAVSENESNPTRLSVSRPPLVTEINNSIASPSSVIASSAVAHHNKPQAPHSTTSGNDSLLRLPALLSAPLTSHQPTPTSNSRLLLHQLSPGVTASDKLFGRRPVNNSSAPSIANRTAHPSITSPTECKDSTNAVRYTVLRGTNNSKRYVVLGNQGANERTPPTNPNQSPVIGTNQSTNRTLLPSLYSSLMMPAKATNHVKSGIDSTGDNNNQHISSTTTTTNSSNSLITQIGAN